MDSILVSRQNSQVNNACADLLNKHKISVIPVSRQKDPVEFDCLSEIILIGCRRHPQFPNAHHIMPLFGEETRRRFINVLIEKKPHAATLISSAEINAIA